MKQLRNIQRRFPAALGRRHVPGAEPVFVCERRGGITIECTEDAVALLLCGQPIGEPVVGQGPFVMNSRPEIRQAMLDYQSGAMGSLS